MKTFLEIFDKHNDCITQYVDTSSCMLRYGKQQLFTLLFLIILFYD